MSETPRPRRRAGREERRAEIVRAAFEMIGERGYNGTTVSAVAEKVGLTQQGVLHYFPTKEYLLTAVLEARDQWDLVAQGYPGDRRRGLPVKAMPQLVEYNASRPEVIQVFTALVGESVTDGHPAQSYFRRRYRDVRAAMAGTLREEFGDHLPSGLTPEQAAPLLAAVMDGLQIQWLLDPEAVDMPAVFQDFLTILAPGSDTTDAGG